MKRTQTCPKCQGRKLWIIEKYRIPSEYAEGTAIPVVAHQKESAGLFSIGRTSAQGHVDLWVCAGCGFSEWWAGDIAALRDDPAAGVRLLDAEAKPAGPFR